MIIPANEDSGSEQLPPLGEDPPSDRGQADSPGLQPSAEAPHLSTSEAHGRARGRALNPYRITHRNLSEGPKRHGSPSSDATPATARAAYGSDDQCPNPITVQRVDKETGEVDAVDLPCGRKGCPHCGPKLRQRYVGHFVRVFSDLPSLKFVTLTVDPKAGVSPEDSTKFVKDRWERRFIKRIKRRTDGELKYVASVEKQKNGYAHLHAVISTTVGESTLRQQWFESGGGVVMEAETIIPGRSLARRIGYVLKYAFEDLDQVEGNAVLASEGIGYHSREAKEQRRKYMEDNGLSGKDRYEFNGPTTGGRRPTSGGITEEDRKRFDQIYDQARSRQYIRWDDQEGRSLPRRGTRIVYDDKTGETTKETVWKVRDPAGGTMITSVRAP